MRIHYLQHVPFEGPAYIAEWAQQKGYQVSGTMLYLGEEPPAPEQFDLLVVMGGPMNIYEEEQYPWLGREKQFVREAIDAGKMILGICLGGQLIADVLGGRVTRNEYKEIGWFSVNKTAEARDTVLLRNFPEQFNAFHWHGDTFSIPPDNIRLASSKACLNQAFEYDGRVVGLQFHLESTAESIGLLMKNSADELVEGQFIQKPEIIRNENINISKANELMSLLLDNFEARFNPLH